MKRRAYWPIEAASIPRENEVARGTAGRERATVRTHSLGQMFPGRLSRKASG